MGAKSAQVCWGLRAPRAPPLGLRAPVPASVTPDTAFGGLRAPHTPAGGGGPPPPGRGLRPWTPK